MREVGVVNGGKGGKFGKSGAAGKTERAGLTALKLDTASLDVLLIMDKGDRPVMIRNSG